MIAGTIASISTQQSSAEPPSGSVISGTARPGNTLTSTAASQWRVNGANISGQAGSSLLVDSGWIDPGSVIDQDISSNTLTVPGYDSDAATDIAAVISASSDWGTTTAQRRNNKWAYDDLIIALKAASVYTAMTHFYRILAGPTTLAGALACGRGGTITNTNFVSGDFSQLTGLKGGTNKRLATGRAGNTLTQNSVSCWGYVNQTCTTGDATFRAMFGNGNTSGGVWLAKIGGANTAESRCQSSSAVAITPGPSSWSGMTGVSRSVGTGINFRTAGSNNAITIASNAPHANVIYFYSLDASSWASDFRLSAIGFHPFATLSSIETPLQTYLSALQ